MKPIEEELEGIIAILTKHLNPKVGKITWRPEEKEARNRLVYTLYVRGYSTIKIAHFIMDTFGISYKQAYVWIRDAKKDAIPDDSEYREKALQIQLERLNDIVENGTERGKIAAMEQINKLLGLYKEKVEVETENNITFTFN